jgi:hypothetical protein
LEIDVGTKVGCDSLPKKGCYIMLFFVDFIWKNYYYYLKKLLFLFGFFFGDYWWIEMFCYY